MTPVKLTGFFVLLLGLPAQATGPTPKELRNFGQQLRPNRIARAIANRQERPVAEAKLKEILAPFRALARAHRARAQIMSDQGSAATGVLAGLSAVVGMGLALGVTGAPDMGFEGLRAALLGVVPGGMLGASLGKNIITRPSIQWVNTDYLEKAEARGAKISVEDRNLLERTGVINAK